MGSCGKAGEAEALLEEGGPLDSGVAGLGSGLRVIIFGVVHEVAADAIGAEANGVESAAGFGLVFRVTVEVSEFFGAVRKLTLAAVFAQASFCERAAELRLIAR